jgi:hypothetical protein
MVMASFPDPVRLLLHGKTGTELSLFGRTVFVRASELNTAQGAGVGKAGISGEYLVSIRKRDTVSFTPKETKSTAIIR